MYKECLSWTKLNTLETSERDFIRYYIFKEKRPVNDGMEYGKRLSEALEVGGLSGDPMLDLALAQIPMLEVSEFELQHDWQDNGVTVPLLVLIDTAEKDLSAFKEFKTGQKRWTPKEVHESGQITFYATTAWLAKGKIPKDIELVGIPTKRQETGILEATGDIYRIPTSRNMQDILKMMVRMKRAWLRIQELKAQYGKL